MHTVAEVGSNVAAFLGKLWRMVEDPETNELISWSESGQSFMIRNQSKFAKELLPRYYKHNNMASFIRQLNMYGFHKIVSPDAGGLKTVNNDEVEFCHTYFVRGHAYMLEHIKRKITKDQNLRESNLSRTDLMNKIIYDVKNMKGRQESFDTKLSTMKQENEALWRELSILRQKHMKQQQIVNKLINFLVSLVQPSRNGLSVKKVHLPMIKGRREHTNSFCSDDSNFDHVKQSDDQHDSPPGPTIHELDPADFLEDIDILQATDNHMLTSPLPEVEPIASPVQNDVEVNLLSTSTENNPILLDLVKDIPEEETLVSIPPSQILPETLVTSKKSTASLLRKGKAKKDNRIGTPSLFTNDKIKLEKNTSPIPSCGKNGAGKNISSVTPASSVLLNGVSVPRDNGLTLMQGAASTEDSLGLDLPIMDVNLIKVENHTSPEPPLEDENSHLSFSNLNCFSEAPSPNELDLHCNLSSSPILRDSISIEGGGGADTDTVSTECVRLYKSPQMQNVGRSEYFRSPQLDVHVDSIQNDLDSLKDLMRGDGLSLDTSTLLNLFEETTNLPSFKADNSYQANESGNDIIGNEVTTYIPGYDFTDMFNNSVQSNGASSPVWMPPTPSTSNLEINTPMNTPQRTLVDSPTPAKRRRK